MSENRLSAPYRTVPSLLEHKDKHVPNETFLHCGGKSISYADFAEHTNRYANGFSNEGVEPGDKVCLYLYNSVEYLYAYFGLAKIGAVAVPIDTRFVGTVLEHILAEVNPKITLIDSQTVEEYNAIKNSASFSSRNYYVGEGNSPQDLLHVDSLVERQDGEEVQSNHTPEEDDILSIIYIQRKADQDPIGISLPHFSYINTGWEVGNTIFGYKPTDKIYAPLPIYNIFTVQLGLMPSLITECEFILGDRFEPDSFWERVRCHEATVFLYLSRMLSVLFNHEKALDYSENSIERAIGHGYGFKNDKQMIGGFKDRFNLNVFECYGVTQAATIVTSNTSEQRKRGSVGKPVSYIEVKIADKKDRPVEDGETGEILIRPLRPNCLMREYYNKPKLTNRDCRNQWIHTGDLGYRDKDGFLHFIANEDNSIYRGSVGGRISTLEIESVINSIPEVEECSVVGITNFQHDDEMKAAVELKDTDSLDEIDICKHCEKKLAHAKVPRYIEICDELPRSPTGKIRKDELDKIDTNDVWDRSIGYDLIR